MIGGGGHPLLPPSIQHFMHTSFINIDVELNQFIVYKLVSKVYYNI